jgi:hypothetical protein
VAAKAYRRLDDTVIHLDLQRLDGWLALIDYTLFRSQVPSFLTVNFVAEAWEITVLELKRLIDSGAHVNLIDVREPHEYGLCHINGSRLVPLA